MWPLNCWSGLQDRPSGVVNERRNTAAARGTVVQRSVPALGMDHHCYQGGTAGVADHLSSASTRPLTHVTSFAEPSSDPPLQSWTPL